MVGLCDAYLSSESDSWLMPATHPQSQPSQEAHSHGLGTCAREVGLYDAYLCNKSDSWLMPATLLKAEELRDTHAHASAHVWMR